MEEKLKDFYDRARAECKKQDEGEGIIGGVNIDDIIKIIEGITIAEIKSTIDKIIQDEFQDKKGEELEAITRGIIKGYIKGLIIGIVKGKTEIVLNMIKADMPVEKIAEYTDMSISQIEKIRVENDL